MGLCEVDGIVGACGIDGLVLLGVVACKLILPCQVVVSQSAACRTRVFTLVSTYSMQPYMESKPHISLASILPHKESNPNMWLVE